MRPFHNLFLPYAKYHMSDREIFPQTILAKLWECHETLLQIELNHCVNFKEGACRLELQKRK